MRTTKNADYGAWIGTGIANIEKFNLEHKDEIDAKKQVTLDKIEVSIRSIKAWLADPNNLKDMRIMSWQSGLYKALAELMGALAVDEELGAALQDSESLMADDLVDIFKTVSGLKDSLVKTQAQTNLQGLVTALNTNGFTALATRLGLLL
jgi:hypothetical protein